MIDWSLWWRKKLGLAQKSYAQCGEDLIIDAVLRGLKISRPFYVDIGAYDPRYMSNTYLFYKRGAHGLCVEPQPEHCRRIQKARPRDVCLNVGIGPKDNKALDFYVLSQDTLSTFSKTEAERVCHYGHTRILRTLKIPVMTLSSLFQAHQVPEPDLISIDLEGDERQALESLDFKRWRPKVFCIETLTYTEDRSEKKQQKTIGWMQDQGYLFYADTYINSIFVDRKRWENR
jgi:FkbM family methyltransferase